MIADNIRKLRKENNMSQDELAEKLGVSRQSVSLWETDQTQPTIENIIALTKIFNVSSDVILGKNDIPETVLNKEVGKKKINRKTIFIVSCAAALLIAVIVAVTLVVCFWNDSNPTYATNIDTDVTQDTDDSSQTSDSDTEDIASDTEAPESETKEVTTVTEAPKIETQKVTPPVTEAPKVETQEVPSVTEPPKKNEAPKETVDIFALCKDFAIQNGRLNGDYCIYQQPATNYGGYEGEYFSISYWAGSNMVEFCLHCPLSDTQSINFYLRMRGGYNGKYEFVSSKYYRDTGESIRDVYGYIDPATFYDGYPLSFDEYYGPLDGQTEFMEESRQGICDLIGCLKRFVEVENMGCSFSDFDFKNF